MRSAEGAVPTSVNDFERMLVADYDQSYLWIQYMAFMLENLDAEAARRVAERAVKQVSMTAEDEKLNLWIAYMNLESKFGTTRRPVASLEVLSTLPFLLHINLWFKITYIFNRNE